jgi:hypothetical protein
MLVWLTKRSKAVLKQRKSLIYSSFVLCSMGAWSKKTQARRWAGDLAFRTSEDQAGHNHFLVSRPCQMLNLPDLFGYLDFI